MEQLQELKQRYAQLEKREQNLLLAAGLVAAVCLFYLIIFKPLNSSVTQLKKSQIEQQRLKSWMQQQVATVKTKGSKTNTGTARGNQSLSVLINKTASSLSLQISRSQPRDNKQYQIWLEDVPYKTLLKWINTLQTQYGINVYSINISSTDNKAVVRANLIFEDSVGL